MAGVNAVPVTMVNIVDLFAHWSGVIGLWLSDSLQQVLKWESGQLGTRLLLLTILSSLYSTVCVVPIRGGDAKPEKKLLSLLKSLLLRYEPQESIAWNLKRKLNTEYGVRAMKT